MTYPVTYPVRCDDCQTILRYTEDAGEACRGAVCGSCRSKWADLQSEARRVLTAAGIWQTAQALGEVR